MNYRLQITDLPIILKMSGIFIKRELCEPDETDTRETRQQSDTPAPTQNVNTSSETSCSISNNPKILPNICNPSTHLSQSLNETDAIKNFLATILNYAEVELKFTTEYGRLINSWSYM